MSGLALLTIAMAAACAALTLHPVYESDPFWQMTLGRAVLEHGTRVPPEPTALRDFSEPAVVPEWLWGVTTYGLYTQGGWLAVSLFLAGVASLVGVGVVRLARYQDSRLPAGAIALVSILAVVLASSRLRLRPQVAFLAILPIAMLLAQRYAVAAGRSRCRIAAALLMLQVLWTQLHGSFVLGPALVALAAGPAWLRRPSLKGALLHGGFGVLLALTVFSSAHGLDTPAYILSHQSGDASLHVEDLYPASWAALNPARSPFAAAYLGLWGVALAGMLVGRRPDLERVGFALLGVALVATANRFFAAAGILLVPLAVVGAGNLARAFPQPRGWLLWAGASASALLVWAAVVIHGLYGPLGVIGPAGSQPRAAAARLAELPLGSAVLSSFSAGGPLGFWLDGRIRTYVDARTPLYFDGADFAVSRDIWTHADALERGLSRFAADAVVVERSRPGCMHMRGALSRDWIPVVVEPTFTTFVRRGRGEEFRTIAACGSHYLAPDACSSGGEQLGAEIDRLAAVDDTAFLDYLRAQRLLRCLGDPERAAQVLPAQRQASGWRKARDRMEGEIAARRGDAHLAFDRLGPLAREGEVEALDTLASLTVVSRAHRAEFRGILEDAVTAWSDHAPPELRANLALLCAEDGDADCVRFHGVRSAARGSARGRSALRWLVANHPDPRVRRDAERWLDALRDFQEPANGGRDGHHP